MGRGEGQVPVSGAGGRGEVEHPVAKAAEDGGDVGADGGRSFPATHGDLHDRSGHLARQPPPPLFIQPPVLFPRRVIRIEDPGDSGMHAAFEPHIYWLCGVAKFRHHVFDSGPCGTTTRNCQDLWIKIF